MLFQDKQSNIPSCLLDRWELRCIDIGFTFKANQVLFHEPFGCHTRDCGSKMTKGIGDCDNNKLKVTLYVITENC